MTLWNKVTFVLNPVYRVRGPFKEVTFLFSLVLRMSLVLQGWQFMH